MSDHNSFYSWLNRSTPRLIVAGAFCLLDAAGGYSRQPPSVSTPTPSSMSEEAWQELLFKNPANATLWNQELERLKADRARFESMRALAQDSFQSRALANNDQLQGIALRHLKRYPEALASLVASEQSLATLWVARGCDTERTTEECQGIAQLRSMTFGLEATVHEDMGDRAQMSSALKNDVAASRGTPRYRKSLAMSITLLVSLDDFPDATSLLLDEIRYVSEKRGDVLLETVEEIGASYSMALFRGISWKPDGSIRDADPRDFVDNHGIGIGRQVKYGMTDWQEDEATFATAQYVEAKYAMPEYAKRDPLSVAKEAGYASVDELHANTRLREYVRREMLDGNFEPVAKLLVHEQLDFQLKPRKGAECPKRPNNFSFAEIRRRLREAPAGTVSTTTNDILFSVQRLAESLNANCRKGM